MTKYFYNTETGQADGTTVTTALLPANGVTPTLTVSGGPTVTFRTAAAAEGALGIRIQAPASSVAQIRFPGLNATDVMWDGGLDCNGSYPSSGCRFLTFHNNSFATLVGGLSISAAGLVSILNSAGTAVWTSAVTMPSTGYWRWGFRITQGSTTSNGTVTLWLYTAYSDLVGAAADYVQLTNVNLLTTATPMTGVIKGKLTTAPSWTAPEFDADQITDNPSVDGLFTGPNSISVAGTVAATSTVAGAVTELSPVSGVIPGTTATSGSISSLLSVVGTAAATTSNTGDATPLRPVAGTIAATSSVTGAVTSLRPVAGAVAATSSVNGAVTLRSPAAGTVAAASAVSGAANVIAGAGFAVTGTVAATSTITGTATRRATAAGSVQAVTTVAAGVTVRSAITGMTTATTTVAGTVTSLLTGVAGTVAAITTVTGSVVILGSLRDITLSASPLEDRWDTTSLPDRFTAASLTERWDTERLPKRFATTPPAPRWTTTPEAS